MSSVEVCEAGPAEQLSWLPLVLWAGLTGLGMLLLWLLCLLMRAARDGVRVVRRRRMRRRWGRDSMPVAALQEHRGRTDRPPPV